MDNSSSHKVNAGQLGMGGTAGHPSPARLAAGRLCPALQRPGLPTAKEVSPGLEALLLAFWQTVLCTSEIHYPSGVYVHTSSLGH